MNNSTETIITIEQLASLLEGVKGARALTIITRTEPRMRKTGNPHAGNCFKVAAVNGMINWEYEAAVNRQRTREDAAADFEAVQHPWGDRLQGTPWRVNRRTGDKYLVLKVERSIWHRYEDRDGNVIDAEAVKPFLSKSSSSRQDVDREVIERDYKLSSIVQVHINGERYKVA